MKNLFLILFVFAFVSFGFIKNSNAVYLDSPANDISHAEAFTEQIEQYTKQGLQYIAEAAQLKAQAQMLASDPASALTSLASNIKGVSQLAGQISQLEQTANQSITAYDNLTSTSTPSQYAQTLSQMQTNFAGEVQGQLQNYNAQDSSSGLNSNIQTQLSTSLNHLSNAKGQTQALQASGAIAGLEVQQLNELNTNLNAQHTLELQQIQKKAATKKQFTTAESFVVGGTLPPSSYDLYGNK